MKFWQRIAFVALTLVFAGIAAVLVGMFTYVVRPHASVVGPLHFVVAWLSVIAAGEAVPPAKRHCDIAAMTVPLLFILTAMAVLGANEGRHGDVFAQWSELIALLTLPAVPMIVFMATLWKNSIFIRAAETIIACSTWLVFLGLRLTDRWAFDGSADARSVGTSMLIASAPFLVALVVSFRGGAVSGAEARLSPR